MQWFLIHTKPRQELVALQNLQNQGYECYLPMLAGERLRQRELVPTEEPLFPRYLFIRGGSADRGWGPVRSTRGVNRLVCFGLEPARVDSVLIERIRAGEMARRSSPEPLFSPGERVLLAEGAFAGLEGVYQIAEGESRVMVLIELLSRPTKLRVSPAALRKVG